MFGLSANRHIESLTHTCTANHVYIFVVWVLILINILYSICQKYC